MISLQIDGIEFYVGYRKTKRKLKFKLGVPVLATKKPTSKKSPSTYHHCCEEVDFMAQITDIQQIPLSLQGTDAKGNPSTDQITGVTWLVDNSAVVSLTPSADGLTCVAAAEGPLGSVTITVNATLGSAPATGSFQLDVIASAATSINIIPGTPTNQP